MCPLFCCDRVGSTCRRKYEQREAKQAGPETEFIFEASRTSALDTHDPEFASDEPNQLLAGIDQRQVVD